MAKLAENMPIPNDGDDEPVAMATLVCSMAIIGMLHDVMQFLQSEGVNEKFCAFMEKQSDYKPEYPVERDTVAEIISGFHTSIDMAMNSGIGVFSK